jgi:hypothetical protein
VYQRWGLSTFDANFANELVARIENRRVSKRGKSRRELVWKDAENLQEFQERRVLSACRAVLHLDRDCNALGRYANRMYPFRADLADETPFRLLDQYRVESIGSPEQKRMRRDSTDDSGRHFIPAIRRGSESRKRKRQGSERESHGDDAAPVDHEAHVVSRAPAPPGDLRDRAVLHLVSQTFVAERRPALRSREGEHPGVFSGAVVVQACGRQPCLVHEAHTPSRQRLMRAACEITFLEADRFEHASRELDVLRFPTVRRAREGELLAPPSAGVEAARFDEGEELKGFRAGAPDGGKRWIACAAEQFPIGVADDCVHVVPRLDRIAPCGDDVEVKVIR